MFINPIKKCLLDFHLTKFQLPLLSKNKRYALAILTGVAIFFPIGQQVRAEQLERLVANPPILELRKEQVKRMTQMALPVTEKAGSVEKQFDLNIDYPSTPSTIWNPSSGRYDKVRLRNYMGNSSFSRTNNPSFTWRYGSN